MLVSDVIRQASRRFGDPEQTLVKAPDYVDWINSAQLELARTTNYLQFYNPFNWVIATFNGGYPLPDDCISVVRVVYDGRPLKLTNLPELDRLGTSTAQAQADPMYFYISGRLFFVHPKAVQDNKLLEMWYAQAPPVVTQSSDELSVPVASQEAVITYCLMRAREMNEDYQGQKISTQEWAALKGEQQFDDDNPHSSFPVVRETDAYSYNDGYY